MKTEHARRYRGLSPDEMEFLAAAEWAQAEDLSDQPNGLVIKGLVMKSASEMHARAKLKRILLSQVPTKH